MLMRAIRSSLFTAHVLAARSLSTTAFTPAVVASNRVLVHPHGTSTDSGSDSDSYSNGSRVSNAFISQPSHRHYSSTSLSAQSQASSSSSDGEAEQSRHRQEQRELIQTIRSTPLLNANGELSTLQSRWNKDKPTVVQQQQEQAADQINGPFFISIGNAAKLNGFLEANPNVPRDQIWVDDFDFELYKSMGYRSFLERPDDGLKLKVRVPFTTLGEYVKYFRIFLKLAPFTDDLGFGELPPGGLVNGGTIVIRDDQIVYEWKDALPGDYPNVQDVMDAALEREQ